MPKIKDIYEPFDPTNKKHLKAFEKSIKKMAKIAKNYKGPQYLIVDKSVFKQMKKLNIKIKCQKSL